MLLAVGLASLLAAAAAAPAPARYDQRQDGEVNVAADVQNVVFVFAIPQKMSLPLDILEDFMKTKKKQNRDSGVQEAQDRADHAMEAFVEPSTPYRVEIGTGERSGSEGRAVEVVIAGRRRSGPEPANEAESDEIKLLGATEQCGPERERDPVTLMCRARASEPTPAETAPQPQPQPQPAKPDPILEQAPEVVPA